MQELKRMITQTPVLAFYDPTKDLTIENDACEYGLGSVLLQNGICQSFPLWCWERYAEKFHHYAYCRQDEIITDHKPLVSIVTKPLSSAPRRLQGLILRVQCYDYSLQYRPGKSIPIPDALSWAPLRESDGAVLETVSNVSLCAINARFVMRQNMARVWKRCASRSWPAGQRTKHPCHSR